MLILTQTGLQWSGGAWGVGESHLRGGLSHHVVPGLTLSVKEGNEMLLAMRLVDSILRFKYPQRKPSHRSLPCQRGFRQLLRLATLPNGAISRSLLPLIGASVSDTLLGQSATILLPSWSWFSGFQGSSLNTRPSANPTIWAALQPSAAPASPLF
jgi:hypothetical protein